MFCFTIFSAAKWEKWDIFAEKRTRYVGIVRFPFLGKKYLPRFTRNSHVSPTDTNEQRVRTESRRIFFAFTLTAVVFCIILIAGYGYLKTLQGLMSEETYSYLNEISSQLSDNVAQNVDSTETKAETLASLARQHDWDNVEDLQQWLESTCDVERISRVYLIDEEGAWLSGGTRHYHDTLKDFSAPIVGEGQTHTGTILDEENGSFLALGTPLDLTVDDTHLVGLVVAITPESIKEQLSLSAFSDLGYAHIVSSDGSAILLSDKETTPFYGDNLFTTFDQAEFLDATTDESIRTTIDERESLQLHYKLEDQEKHATITPIDVEDWYLISVLPADFVYEKSSAFYALTAAACTGIATLFALLVLVIIVVNRRRQRELEQAAYVDPVTDGHTLLYFEKAILSNVASEQIYAIIYLNLRDFKEINERIGRETADGILKAFYEIIDDGLTENECVCRFVADHFCVCLKGGNPNYITNRIKAWANSLKAYGRKLDPPVNLRLSAGICFTHTDDDRIRHLIDHANTARKMISTYSYDDMVPCGIYDTALQHELDFQQDLIDHAERALEEGEFLLYLQPKHELTHDTVAGAEALVRWQNPTYGLLTPRFFISSFERTGFICKMDLHVFDLVCAQIQNALDQGLEPVPVSVNVSKRCFDNPDFLDSYESIWRRYNFDASLIELEFLESIFYNQIDEFKKTIERIHRIGFTCSLDDFGSGYSSLGLLGRLKIDTVKMDRSFVSGNDSLDPQMQKTIEGVIALIKSLGMTVVAEGIEDEKTLDLLRSHGCDMVQGYVFSRPLPASDFSAYLADHTRL